MTMSHPACSGEPAPSFGTTPYCLVIPIHTLALDMPFLMTKKIQNMAIPWHQKFSPWAGFELHPSSKGGKLIPEHLSGELGIRGGAG